MQNARTSTPFIFFLCLEDALPKAYYAFDKHLKDLGFMLVPVKMDQIQSLVALSEQEQVIILCSVTDTREFKIYNEKIRGFLKFILKSKRLTFMHMSGFGKLNDQRLYLLLKNYYFLRYPLDAKSMSLKISKYHQLKTDERTVWPGGKKSVQNQGAA